MKLAKKLLRNINGVLSIDKNKASKNKKHDTTISRVVVLHDKDTDDYAIIGVTKDNEIVELDMNKSGVVVL